MMCFAPKPEPTNFPLEVRAPGQRALKELRGDKTAPKRAGRPRKAVAKIKGSDLTDYWTRCLGDLRTAFDEVCAYACVWIDVATTFGSVDHFVPKDTNPDLAYEWSNFRYASQAMNTRKRDDLGICDPFLVRDGDFEHRSSPTFGMFPNPNRAGCVASARVQHTINDARARQRTSDAAAARGGLGSSWPSTTNPLAGWAMLMSKTCPLLAREYVRQFEASRPRRVSPRLRASSSPDPRRSPLPSARAPALPSARLSDPP
jgi:hypothetical protein